MPVPAVALDRSNKWDHLRQVRLSAARQTCTMLSARLLAPWVTQLGSRGNPARYRAPQATLAVHCTLKYCWGSGSESQTDAGIGARLCSDFELLCLLER